MVGHAGRGLEARTPEGRRDPLRRAPTLSHTHTNTHICRHASDVSTHHAWFPQSPLVTSAAAPAPAHPRPHFPFPPPALLPAQTRDEVERGFFRRAMDMCQDVDYLVRRCMCEQVGAIGRVAGRDLLLRDMLGELFELLRDEELQVGVGEV